MSENGRKIIEEAKESMNNTERMKLIKSFNLSNSLNVPCRGHVNTHAAILRLEFLFSLISKKVANKIH
jgi:hypothetical protein